MAYNERQQGKATYKISKGITASIYTDVYKITMGSKKDWKQVETALFCSLPLLIFPHGRLCNTLSKDQRISDY